RSTSSTGRWCAPTATTRRPATSPAPARRAPGLGRRHIMARQNQAQLVLTGGLFSTRDDTRPAATAVAIADGRFAAVGSDEDVQASIGPATRVLELGGRRVIPG